MDDPYKLSGWTFSIYGGFTSISLLWIAFLVLEPGSLAMRSTPTMVIALYCFALATHLLALLGGILLLLQNPFAHKVALPAALFMMISFPVGTIVGMIYFWRWQQDN